MQVTVKIKFGTSKQYIESFGGNRYLVYLLSKADDPFHLEELTALLAKQFGVSPKRVELRIDRGESKVFEV